MLRLNKLTEDFTALQCCPPKFNKASPLTAWDTKKLQGPGLSLMSPAISFQKTRHSNNWLPLAPPKKERERNSKCRCCKIISAWIQEKKFIWENGLWRKNMLNEFLWLKKDKRWPKSNYVGKRLDRRCIKLKKRALFLFNISYKYS